MKGDVPPTNIALAYIDCDMYSSTKTVLEFLLPRLKHGRTLAFDDYFCWADDRVSGGKRGDVGVADQQRELEPAEIQGLRLGGNLLHRRKCRSGLALTAVSGKPDSRPSPGS